MRELIQVHVAHVEGLLPGVDTDEDERHNGAASKGEGVLVHDFIDTDDQSQRYRVAELPHIYSSVFTGAEYHIGVFTIWWQNISTGYALWITEGAMDDKGAANHCTQAHTS